MYPYWADFGLGLVLLSAYLLMVRVLGTSAGFASLVSWIMSNVAPDNLQEMVSLRSIPILNAPRTP